MCVHLPFYSYTFTRSSGSLNLHIQIFDYLLLIRYLERITCILRSQISLAWHPFSVFSYFFSFIPIAFMILCLGLMLVPFPFHMLSYVNVYCDIAVILIYHSAFIACSGCFRFSVYTWGIFLVYTSLTLVATPFLRILGSRL